MNVTAFQRLVPGGGMECPRSLLSLLIEDSLQKHGVSPVHGIGEAFAGRNQIATTP